MGFAKQNDTLLLELHENLNKLYKRDTTDAFYDVTNCYLNKDRESDLIRGLWQG